MGKMRFDVKCVFECLKKNGVVYSVRSYNLSDSYVEVEGIGKCKREYVKECFKVRDLVEFVELSGFTDIKDWVSKIRGFIGSKRKYLYKVTIV